MQAKTLECQLAQAQLGRYLSGERLSAELIHQLESHLTSCLDCREAAKAKRDTLEHVVSTPTAVAEVNITSKPKGLLNVAHQALVGKGKNQKPLILSTLLVAVLYTMTALAKDPTRLFGPKLSTAPTLSAAQPISAPIVTESKPTPKSEPKPLYGPPTPPKSEEPAPIKAEPETPRPAPAKTTKHRLSKPSVKPTTTRGIRVYSPTGELMTGG